MLFTAFFAAAALFALNSAQRSLDHGIGRAGAEEGESIEGQIEELGRESRGPIRLPRESPFESDWTGRRDAHKSRSIDRIARPPKKAPPFATARSVGHRVDNVVDSVAVGERGHRFGVVRNIGELPGVADIGIEVDGHHHAFAVVIHRPPGRDRNRGQHYLDPAAGARAADGANRE